MSDIDKIIVVLGRIEDTLKLAFKEQLNRARFVLAQTVDCTEEEPSQPPTPSLNIIRRFAKVAGGNFSESAEVGAFHFSVPGTSGYFREERAARWLDSPEALDAAAIVAVRRGNAIIVERVNDALVRVTVGYWKKPPSAGPGYPVVSGESETAPRAAVLACLKAFEEKS